MDVPDWWRHANEMKTPIPTHAFVLVVARHEERFLVVQERDGTWYLPAGRVEPAENFVAAAVRETLEEASQLVGLHGIVGIDHSWHDGRARLRVVFSAYRAVLLAAKQVPDNHTLQAAWLPREVIANLPLRDREVLRWIDEVRLGCPLLPTERYEWSGPSGSTSPSATRRTD